ncbi:thioredoxin fold domain-containing protein [Aquincola sp. S2]|uniref:Thioredoxin fold domain-containing protein n=1 Tax=Pseudaquabacterium terrae TaxID=2732868 RepID=A0ABX2EAE4_9BURK|nr:thioredoxin fold domain-containing protein [Aquabacterium terrae]NRF65471.1 thioredoxin fold domain-containing protein [Aquabacterium terrae]
MHITRRLLARLHACLALLALASLLLAAGPAAAQFTPSPHAIDIPRWFSNSLLDFKDEIPEAAREGKRVLVYFGQDGCPYCKALMKASFGPGAITDKTRKHFVAIAINIWGDADVTWIDGTKTTEKALARMLKVQFTPTLLFFETDGKLVLRLNGYLPPERFTHVLDYVIQRRDREQSLAEYLSAQMKEPEIAVDGPRPYLMRNPANLARAGRGRPLAVLFESPSCKACAEMHAEAFARPSLRSLLGGFDVARLLPGAPATLITPDGRRTETRSWARDLNIMLYPTVVFFDAQGREAFRFDGHMRPFHIESAFDYVASGAHAREPQFQRFVQARAEKLREQGKAVDLWR